MQEQLSTISIWNGKIHPVADLFPLLSPVDAESLVESIRQNGLLHSLTLAPDGTLLDGRNRLIACKAAGVEPRFVIHSGDPLAFIIASNLTRRHLSESQRAMIAERLANLPKHIHKSDAQICASVSQSDAAELLNVSRRSVQYAAEVRHKAPELAEKIEAGELPLGRAVHILRDRDAETRRAENAIKVASAPSIEALRATFATIVIDPPWDWGDEGDVDQLGRARPTYQTMPYQDLLQLPVDELADIDCHLYLWITNRSLPKGFGLLEAWGFRYITCLTWVKPSYGMGNYFRGQTEHVLFGVKGSQPLKRKDVGTYFTAPRGPNGHSSKPVEFYDLVESCSPGPYLEMFARVQRDGWSAWGGELP